MLVGQSEPLNHLTSESKQSVPDLFVIMLQSQNQRCRIAESDVINAPEPDTQSISFMTRHELRGSDVPGLPLAEVGLVRAAAPPAAVPALQPPSQVLLVSHAHRQGLLVLHKHNAAYVNCCANLINVNTVRSRFVRTF